MAAHLIRKISNNVPIGVLKFFGNIWPPYLGAGVRILYVSPDYRHIRVKLKRSWWNTNYVGTQFGGSMYSMVDPFYMMMLIQNLGRDYIVWDKAASIEFKKPGVSELFAEFLLSEEQIQSIKQTVDTQSKYIFDLTVDIKDKDANIIASAKKTLYVRKKV